MRATPFQRLLWSFLVIVILVLCAALAARSFHGSEEQGKGQEAAAPLPKLVQLPPFSLTDQDGKTVTNKDLAGKIWAAQFFFTECPGPCPAVSRQLAEVQQMLEGVHGVRLVSISIDPADDTPAKMRAYAARVGADPHRWRFLTGSDAAIQDLVRKGFLIAFQKNAPELQASQGIFVHSTKIALVDGTGAVRAYYEGLDVETPQKIVDDIRTLLREPPQL